MRMGRDADALEDYDQAIRIAPRHVAAYVNRGSFFSKRGQLDLAEADFQAALELVPNNPVVLNNLAWVYVLRGNYRAALDLVNRALDSKVEPRVGRDTQAHALMGLGQVEAAEEAFLEAAQGRGAGLVRQYQEALIAKGYTPGRSDGVLDAATRAALSACIRDNCRLLLDFPGDHVISWQEDWPPL